MHRGDVDFSFANLRNVFMVISIVALEKRVYSKQHFPKLTLAVVYQIFWDQYSVKYVRKCRTKVSYCDGRLKM